MICSSNELYFIVHKNIQPAYFIILWRKYMADKNILRRIKKKNYDGSQINANIIDLSGSSCNRNFSPYNSNYYISRGGSRMVGALRQTTWWGPLRRSA